MSGLRRLPSKFKDEELLDIIEDTENPEVLEKPNENSVIQFLADFGIYPGTNEVSGKLLYKWYKQCTKNSMNSVQFHFILQGYAEHKQLYNDRHYLLNKESLVLTKQLADFIAIKKKNRKVNTRFYRKHMEDFIEQHSLKKGTKNIPVAALYYFYDKWQYVGKGSSHFKFTVFISMIKLYFETKRSANIWCIVMIDDSFFKQFPKETEIALEWAKKYNGSYQSKEARARKEKKDQSKIKNKVPRS